MGATVAKALLAPALVVAVSLTARRFGPKVGGLVAGIPVVAGPALLLLALAHGRAFAAAAATASLMGLSAIAWFVAAYGRLSQRATWLASLVGSWAVYLIVSAMLSGWASNRSLALVLAATSVAIASRTPRMNAASAHASIEPPRGDLALRAAAALLLVTAVAAVAGSTGARFSGLLSSFPILASVLLACTHAQQGVSAAVTLSSGLFGGLWTFGTFCFALSWLLTRTAIAPAFVLALTAAISVQVATLLRVT